MVRVLERSDVKGQIDYLLGKLPEFLGREAYEVAEGVETLLGRYVIAEKAVNGKISAIVCPESRMINVCDRSLIEKMRALATELEDEFKGDEYRINLLF